MTMSSLTTIGVVLGLFGIYMFFSHLIDKHYERSFRKSTASKVMGSRVEDEPEIDDHTEIEPIKFSKSPYWADPSRSGEPGNIYND